MLPFLCATSVMATQNQEQISFEESPYGKFQSRWSQAAGGLGASSFSVVVVKDGNIVLLDSWGYRDINRTRQANPDTTYYIASITKTYTALAISILEEQGKLSVKDPISKHLPWFKLNENKYNKTITIEDLLCHRPGINSEPVVTLDAFTGEITEKRYQYWLAKTGTATGETTYTNVHFTLLGRVIEKVTGMPWQSALQKMVYNPLKLTNTTSYASTMYGRENCAMPLVLQNGIFRFAQPIKTDSTMHAAGGIGTTARDLGTYMISLLKPGRLGNPVSERLQKNLFAQLSSVEPNGSIRIINGFSRAWNIGSYRNLTQMVSHGGGYDGAYSKIALLPEKGIGFAVVVNGGVPASGLEAILMLDIFDQELAFDNQRDLLPIYLEEANKYYAKAQPSPENIIFQTPIIPHPEQLIGIYKNEEFGTLIFESLDGLTIAKLGHYKLTLKAENGGYSVLNEADGTFLKPILKNQNLVGFSLNYSGQSLLFNRAK